MFRPACQDPVSCLPGVPRETSVQSLTGGGGGGQGANLCRWQTQDPEHQACSQHRRQRAGSHRVMFVVRKFQDDLRDVGSKTARLNLWIFFFLLGGCWERSFLQDCGRGPCCHSRGGVLRLCGVWFESSFSVCVSVQKKKAARRKTGQVMPFCQFRQRVLKP